MISFTLKCENDHQFQSWFKSGDAFDTLIKSGMVTCETCGSSKIEKTLMAPSVSIATKENPELPKLTSPQTDVEKAMDHMRKEVEKNSEYVGVNFATEARAMHDGDSPKRSIYGEAKPEEAKALIEDGVAVTPLPFMPKRNTN